MWESQYNPYRSLRKAVTRDEFSKAAAEPWWGLWWRFGGRYERRKTRPDGVSIIRAPARVWKERDFEVDAYQPLVEHPYLFLRFAQLAENDGLDIGPDGELQTRKNAQVAWDWAQEYGVLGLTPSKEEGAWWGDACGGAQDSVAAFAFEAWIAHRVLNLYDATYDKDGIQEERVTELLPNSTLRRLRGVRTDDRKIELYSAALWHIVGNIQYRVAKYVYPCMYWSEEERHYVETYDFANLCGALWLQAMWLLSAGNDVRRCQYPACNRIIDYKQPEKPSEQRRGERKEYKRRSDIKYCQPKETGRYCRVYHKRWKERQQRLLSRSKL